MSNAPARFTAIGAAAILAGACVALPALAARPEHAQPTSHDRSAPPTARAPGKPARPAGGNVAVTLEPVAFGPSDGLPEGLQRGTTYAGSYPIWLTPGAKNAHASFRLADGRSPVCRQHKLAGGVVTRVNCEFSTDRRRVSGYDSTMIVTVKLAGEGMFSHVYRHTVG